MKFFHLTIFELKRLAVLFIIWTIIWAGMAYLIVSTYDAVAASSQELQKLTEAMPKELLAAFSMTSENLVTFEGYFNSKFGILFILAGGVLASYLGVARISKEISNKSLLFLIAKPVSRLQVFLAKAIAVMTAIIASNIIVFITCIVAYKLAVTTNTTIPTQFFIFAFLGITIFQYFFAGLGFLFSVMLEEGKALGLSILSSLLAFILNIVTALEGMPEFIKYISPYSYLDIQYIAQHSLLKFPHTLIFVVVGTGFFILALSLFRNKDLEM
jgi:ABC-2 type transport system permease protein